MKQLTLVIAATVLVGGLFLSCSSSESNDSTQVVEDFYKHLNDGEYLPAMALYSAEVRTMLERPDGTVDESFESWALLETKEGKVERVDIVGTEAGAEATKVEFDIVYADGVTERRSVSLTQEEGQWKLGFIQKG